VRSASLRTSLAVALLIGIGCAFSDSAEINPAQNNPGTPWLKSAPKSVFAHFMVAYRNKSFSGAWSGWNYSNAHVSHNPDQMDPDGRRDIASVYYPTIGAYDMTDPYLVEEHCQLLKMIGVDGIVFALGAFDGSWWVASVKLYLDALKRYGMHGVIDYQESHLWQWPDPAITTREEAINRMYFEMTQWLQTFKETQYKVRDRPLLTVFTYEKTTPLGLSRMSTVELKTWLEQFPLESRPLFVTSWFRDEYAGIINGDYDWPKIEGSPPSGTVYRAYSDMEKSVQLQDEREKIRNARFESGKIDFYIAGTWPGFDDSAVWGWGGGPRCIPRLNGALYRYQWERVLASNIPIIRLITWNDWNEGTNIEPSAEFGYRYVEMARDYIATFKNVPRSESNLQVPEWIYKIRKSSREPAVLKWMDKASEEIRKGNYAKAESIVQPLAEKLNIRAPRYWDLNGVLSGPSTH